MDNKYVVYLKLFLRQFGVISVFVCSQASSLDRGRLFHVMAILLINQYPNNIRIKVKTWILFQLLIAQQYWRPRICLYSFSLGTSITLVQISCLTPQHWLTDVTLRCLLVNQECMLVMAQRKTVMILQLNNMNKRCQNCLFSVVPTNTCQTHPLLHQQVMARVGDEG